MSMIRMFKPSAGLQESKISSWKLLRQQARTHARLWYVGVGIGGTFDKCALLAKKALMRPLDSQNPDPFYAELEEEMFEKVKQTWNRTAGIWRKDHSHRPQH